MVLETLMKLCVTEKDFLEKIFFQENRENWPKRGFLNLLKNLVINFFNEFALSWILKLFPVFLHISHIWDFFLLRHGPKCSQLIRLQDFLINNISVTNFSNRLIFCLLIQIYINYKLIKKFLSLHGQTGHDQSGHGL